MEPAKKYGSALEKREYTQPLDEFLDSRW